MAMLGLDTLKEALMLCCINPKIGGLLIDGKHGTGKSAAVRGFKDLLHGPYYEVPLSVSDDRLTGSIDLEKTLQKGEISVEPGILTQVNGGVLFIDDVELLPEHASDILIQARNTGKNLVEREGIHFESPSEFIMIGTTSCVDEVRSALLDQFGLYVSTENLDRPEARVDLVHRRNKFEEDPERFCRWYGEAEKAWFRNIEKAKKLLPDVLLSDENYQQIVGVCTRSNAAGHRADIILAQTARAVAALWGNEDVTTEDIQEAAQFVLPHRARNVAEFPEEENQPEPQTETKHPPMDSPISGNSDSPDQPHAREIKKVFAVGKAFKIVPIFHKQDKKSRQSGGRRSVTKSSSKNGRYIYATERRTNDDLALDATLRAAAPFQKTRDKGSLALKIETSDIREKVRQRKTSNLLVFVVDASGSMGAQKRMEETKGAVLSLLKDAYIKRDKVALVTFRDREARVILPPTSSAQRGFQMLSKIETGGRTPLNSGLEKGLRVVQNQLRQNPDILPMMIIITDGIGNVCVKPNKNAKDEMLEIGERIGSIPQLETLIIDIETGERKRLGRAKQLAAATGGAYYPIEDLKSQTMVDLVRKGV